MGELEKIAQRSERPTVKGIILGIETFPPFPSCFEREEKLLKMYGHKNKFVQGMSWGKTVGASYFIAAVPILLYDIELMNQLISPYIARLKDFI
jgi:hypothetical protein